MSASMSYQGALVKEGWHLSADGYAVCSENDSKSLREIIKYALDLDLKETGEKSLPEGINQGKIESVSGPCVLQIQKIRNCSAPKDNEDSQAAPPLLKLTLTDGQNSCIGLQISPIDKLSLNTPPGTKIKIMGLIPLRNGLLMLNNYNTFVLGGNVDKMVESWQLKKSLQSLAKSNRMSYAQDDGNGPPPFIPFGQRDRTKDISYKKKDNFKALNQTVNQEKKGSGENDEFSQHRKEMIKEIEQQKREGQSKTFGGGDMIKLQEKDIAKLVEKGFSNSEAKATLDEYGGNYVRAERSLMKRQEYELKRLERAAEIPEREERKPQRGRGRNRNKDEEPVGGESGGKPSGPATLFDFLETKITKDNPKKSQPRTNEKSNVYVEDFKKLDISDNRDRQKSAPERYQSKPVKTNQDENYFSKMDKKDTNRKRTEYGRDSRKNKDTYSENNQDNYSSYSSTKDNYNSQGQGRYRDNRNNRQEDTRNNRQEDTYSKNKTDSRPYSESYSSEKRGSSNYRDDSSICQGGGSKYYEGGSKGYQQDNQYSKDREQPKYYEGSSSKKYQKDNQYSYDREKSEYYEGSGSKKYSNGREKSEYYEGSGSKKYQKDDQYSYDKKEYEYYEGSSSGKYQQDDKFSNYREQSKPKSRDSRTSYQDKSERTSDFYQDDNYFYDKSQSSQKNPPASFQIKAHVPQLRKWKIGDYCLAKYWEDGKHYRANVIAIHDSGKTCVVSFPDYGNTEEVMISDVRTVSKHGWADSGHPQSYMQAPQMVISQTPQFISQPAVSQPFDMQQFTGTLEFHRSNRPPKEDQKSRPQQQFYQPPGAR